MTDYQFFKSIHVCVNCHKRQAEPNIVRCWECNERQKQLEKNRHKKVEYNTTVKKRKELGICTLCGKRKAKEGRVKCGICLAREREKQRTRRGTTILRSERQSYGLCYICGTEENHNDSGLCKKCYDTATKNVAKGREKQKILQKAE